MTNEKLYEVLGDINETHVKEAREYRKTRKPAWVKWGAMAACLCLIVVGAFIAPNLGDGALDYAETVIYNNMKYAVCGVGEANILEECGLPTEITKDLAGKHLGYLAQGEKNTLVIADDLENSKVELFEYAPRPNDNVYILCIEGEYYAAIRWDSDGYHGILEFDKGV